MKIFERIRRRNGGSAAPDAGTSHAFRPMNDSGMGAAAAGAGGAISGQALGMNVAVTGNFVREKRCGVPGSGQWPGPANDHDGP